MYVSVIIIQKNSQTFLGPMVFYLKLLKKKWDNGNIIATSDGYKNILASDSLYTNENRGYKNENRLWNM